MPCETLDDDVSRLTAWCDSILNGEGVSCVVAYIGNAPDLSNCIAVNPIPSLEGEAGFQLAARIREELDRATRLWQPCKKILIRMRGEAQKSSKKVTPNAWYEDNYRVNCDPGPIDAPHRGASDAMETVMDQFRDRTASGIMMDGAALSAQNGSFWAIMGLNAMNNALGTLERQLNDQRRHSEQLTQTNSQLAKDAMEAHAARFETEVKADAAAQLSIRDQAKDGMKLELVRLLSTNVDRLLDVGIAHLSGRPPSDDDSMKRFVEGYVKSNPAHIQSLMEANGLTQAPQNAAGLAAALNTLSKSDPGTAMQIVNAALAELEKAPPAT